MLRSRSERVIQTLTYEIGGLAIAAPIYALIFGAGSAESLGIMLALSVAVLLWTPFFNTVCDYAELRLVRRVASDRPLKWRVLHAAGLEVSTVIVTLPILIVLGGHGFLEALLLDIGLSALYAAYGFVFHLVYDRLRPVRGAEAAS